MHIIEIFFKENVIYGRELQTEKLQASWNAEYRKILNVMAVKTECSSNLKRNAAYVARLDKGYSNIL